MTPYTILLAASPGLHYVGKRVRLSGIAGVCLRLLLLVSLGQASQGITMPQKAAARPSGGAGRGGRSAAEVSKGTEGLILNVLSSRGAGAGAELEDTNVKKIGKVWDELKELG